MLSVVPIKQSSVSSNYYLKQDGGYYIENSKNDTLYQWFGKGAHDLGLTGAINNADHNRVYSGRLPNGETIGKQMPDGSIKGRPGYDLTFSMNKDISLIICASNDKKMSDYFLNAHIDAVKTALTEVEKKIEARITIDGLTTFETTKNMITSLCTHFSSRAGDPDVHTHALIANATKRSDEKWRALATDMSRKNGFFEMIRDNATYFGAIYQNEMALATKNWGFQIESIHKNGMFKITGFPNNLRDHFSKRRKQIEGIVSTLNPSAQQDKKTYDKVAQHSKASKETIDQQSFYEKSKRSVESYLEKNHDSKNFDKIVSDCIKNEKPFNSDETQSSDIAFNAIKNSVAELSKFNVFFSKSKIAHRAMTLHLGEMTNQAIENEFYQTIKSGNLIPLKNNEYTTKALIERENKLLQSIKDAAINTPKNDNQNHFSNILHKNRFSIITEPNNIQDKNKCLSDLITTLENEGKKIKVLTIDKSINQDLNCKKTTNTSIFERLKNIAKSDIAVNTHAFLKQYESEINMPLNNIFSKDAKEIFIVDEAKRLDFDTVQKLIDLTEKRKAHIVFLKNHNGRHSVLSGNPIELIEKCDIEKVDARKLYSNSNHQNSEKNLLSSNITITEAPNSDQPQSTLSKQTLRHKTIATMISVQSPNQIDNSIAVSHSKRSTEQLNITIREELKRTGKISDQQYIIKTLKPIYLDDTQKTQAKFYPENAILKTYLGRGVFRTQKILGHDTTQNKVVLQSEFGRRSLGDPQKIAKEMERNIAGIYEEKSISLGQADKIILSHENKMSRQLNLQSNLPYKITEISEKRVVLRHINSEKIIKTKLSSLGELAINYGYAISGHASLSGLKNNHVFCNLPAHAVDKNLLSDITRYADKVNVVTDDAGIVQEHIEKVILKQTLIENDKSISGKMQIIQQVKDIEIST